MQCKLRFLFIVSEEHDQHVDYFENFDLENIHTPVNYLELQILLIETDYDKTETPFLVDRFRYGFDLEYQGPVHCKSSASNLPLTVGSRIELWNKLMKEVKLKRVAGPFDTIPFENYIQSPIGLVPKAGGDQTRLIFHLSHDCSDGKSVNACTPKELCSTKYCDLDHVIRNYIKLRETVDQDADADLQSHQHCHGYAKYKLVVVYSGKTDVKSAFRIVPLLWKCWPWLTMFAVNPLNGKIQYFVDKCLPFGASISCSHFQRMSNALKHIA